MTHKIRTLAENGKYIGQALIDNQVVYTTPPQNDLNVASRLVTEYIRGAEGNEQRVSFKPTPVSPTFTNNVPTPIPTSQPVPRKCCGRG
jgi:hypothetical protein